MTEPRVKGHSSRPYSSSVRAEAARRTRFRVVQAAGHLFIERGYAATSLHDIANAAGVARPTVTAAFGSKATILGEVLDVALAGDDEPVPVRERPWFAPVWQADTGSGCLEAYADVVVLISERAAQVVDVIHRASDGGPGVEQLWQRWQRNRRLGAAMVIDRDVVLAGLRPGLERDAAVDVLWTLNDSSLYRALVRDAGWSTQAYRRWLGDSMCRLLLDPA